MSWFRGENRPGIFGVRQARQRRREQAHEDFKSAVAALKEGQSGEATVVRMLARNTGETRERIARHAAMKAAQIPDSDLVNGVISSGALPTKDILIARYHLMRAHEKIAPEGSQQRRHYHEKAEGIKQELLHPKK